MFAPRPQDQPNDGPPPARRYDLAFWALVGLVAGVLVAPLWFGPMPPTTDFGGHSQVAHGFARLTDGTGGAWPNVWADVIERRGEWWLPNLLVVRLAALLHPAVDAITAMRLWSTLALVATTIGLVMCLEAFGRSRWFVFLVLPLVFWNSFVGLGFINYYFGLACLPFALVLARRIGTDTTLRPRLVVALTLLAVLSFFAHAFASFLVMIAVTVVLVTSVARWRRLLAGLALVPTAALWLHWYTSTMGATEARELHFEMPQKFRAFVHLSMDLFDGASEEMVLVALALALLLTFASSVLRPPAPLADAAPRGSAAGWHARVRASSLHLLLVVLLAVYFWLPTYRGDMPTAERTIPAIVWILFMLPRARPEPWPSRLAIGASLVASVVLAVIVGRGVRAFEDQELRPALALIEMIPRGTRAQCVDVQYARPIFHFRPLDHGCDGLIAVHRDAFAGGAFADTTHAAVYLKPGRRERRLFDHRWQQASDLADIDWLLARGPHSPPAQELAATVAWIDDPATGGRAWTLYRSRVAQLAPPPFELVRGGPGGFPASYDCPQGHALTALTVALTKDQRYVQSVGAECSRLVSAASDADPATLERARVRIASPRAGGSGRRSLTCGAGQVIVGLALRAGLLVDAVALACAPARAADAPPLVPATIGAFRGGPGGHREDVPCPPGMIATGLRTSAGANVDALGLACRPLDEVRQSLRE